MTWISNISAALTALMLSCHPFLRTASRNKPYKPHSVKKLTGKCRKNPPPEGKKKPPDWDLNTLFTTEYMNLKTSSSTILCLNSCQSLLIQYDILFDLALTMNDHVFLPFLILISFALKKFKVITFHLLWLLSTFWDWTWTGLDYILFTIVIMSTHS